MNELNSSFDVLVNNIYGLSMEDRVELKELLEHNIADSRRDEIKANILAAKNQQKIKKLKFSADIGRLKKAIFFDIETHDEVY